MTADRDFGFPAPGRIAFAVVHDDPPAVFVAADADVLSRVLALELVARTPAARVSNPARLERMRAALLEERWADALGDWIDETGHAVDGYPDETIWTDARLDLEHASLEIRMAPLFNEDPAPEPQEP
jgi:hypothetical protein